MLVLVAVAATSLIIGVLVARQILVPRAVAAAEETFGQLLHRDDLTGLASRRRFVDEVAVHLDREWRGERLPAVIQVSLDRFKQINDSMGHLVANQILSAVAQRLVEAAARFGAEVARTGGDDFAIVDSSAMSTETALMHAEALLAIVRAPIVLGDQTVFVTASVGVAVAPRRRSITPEELIRRADIATHRAKFGGRDRVALFDESMQAEIAARMDVETALHGAIGRREMRLYHQPIVDISTGQLAGFESLMRWQRSPNVTVPPTEFIHVAEETGLINELGSWALHEALGTLREWIDAGIAPPTTTISVNVSPRQIADPRFADVVREALDAFDLPASLLWLEITETMMVEEPDLAGRTLREVCEMGVRIALDDFGTGYSSLSLLQRFPIHRIKIDRAFVSGIADRPYDRALVRTIIAMANSMALDLVAEGIETVEQLQLLRELGCAKAQGYLISRPVPAEAIRSTMSAMEELAGLSMFSEPAVQPEPEPEPAPVEQPARMTAVTDPFGAFAPFPVAGLLGGPRSGTGNR